jgi:hypothetical protein
MITGYKSKSIEPAGTKEVKLQSKKPPKPAPLLNL